MNVQEKLAAIEQHAAKTLIEVRELMVYLTGHPAAVVSFDDVPERKPVRVVSFPGRTWRDAGPDYVSPLEESMEIGDWDDAA
jgi:hypothetical protein